MTVKILSLSDVVLDFIYSPHVRHRFPDVDLIIGCGDLPYYYLEYVTSALDAPLFYVRGNHANEIEYSENGQRSAPAGGVDLHRRVLDHQQLLLAGVEGSLWYRPGACLYTQNEMWAHVLGLTPRLLLNRVIHGRYLDVFVSHAPPMGIHDQEDLAHRGIAAFRWLLHVFKPRYHLHGHTHVYRQDKPMITDFEATRVINTYGFAVTEVIEVTVT